MKLFLPLLAVLFIALKLLGYINWSWWLVLLPMYAGAALLTGVLVLAFLVALVRSK